MKLFLLDAGGAGLVIAVLLAFMFAAIVIEAIIMMLMKYNKAGKAFLDSLVINLVSLGAGYITLYFYTSLEMSSNELLNLFLLFLLTVLIEGVTLYLLNRSKPANKTILVAVVINLTTYLGLYFINYF
jgi:hypothetical protein